MLIETTVSGFANGEGGGQVDYAPPCKLLIQAADIENLRSDGGDGTCYIDLRSGVVSFPRSPIARFL